jgi:hypothetical protein
VRGPGNLFVAGATVVRRDVYGGRIWSATPKRVIADDGYSLVLARWPGVRMMGPVSWVASHRDGTGAQRLRAVRELASGHWDLAPWIWSETTVLTLCEHGKSYSVERFLDADQNLRCWYVNFQRPYLRTGLGVDTFDLLLDLVVEPDGKYTWKDEDEYRHARRLRVVRDADHIRVLQAREEVVELLERRQGPFADSWQAWKLDPSWPLPRLPRGWQAARSNADSLTQAR